ncbi:hypothetical protein IFM46972_11182 [Aspergillus udagawae]|uniref:Uncharacterized protein n=1 Tax=Aspergillus udagawae TaxID=91492 RepID=A0A8H3SFN4_9EURO|nr:hypothetical protein IFM46972_11182 [Aspergillus udagawae]
MASAVLGILLPLVAETTATLVKDEVDRLQAQYPGSTPFEAIAKGIEHLLSDIHLPETVKKELQNLHLANFVAKFSNVNEPLIKAVFESPLANTLREFAQKFDTSAILKIVGDEAKTLADELRTAAFNVQPTATVQGMVEKDKVPLTSSNPAVKSAVVAALSKMQDDYLAKHPISALSKLAPDVIKAVPPEVLPHVQKSLNQLSRLQTISPSPKAMEQLANMNLMAALPVASSPRNNFISAVVSGSNGEVSAPVAGQIHDNATAVVARNENMLMAILQSARGTGLKAIDGDADALSRQFAIQQEIQHRGLSLNLENLFNSNDRCACDDCTTVYSAASYFVDLLNYLRNNNLSPINLAPNISTAGKPDNITGTVLEKLFRRRPDLGDLELTCANTTTILPYIDLANEVMESFIVHLDTYDQTPSAASNGYPQATIDVFNVDEFTESAELLGQPQNVNEGAYRTLATAVYPFTLPYHLPISTARVFLQYLKVARGDLLDRARLKPPSIKPYGSYTAETMARTLRDLQRTALDRQVSAEYLGLVQEEYITLTKEAFFPVDWFTVTENITLAPMEYQTRIGVRKLAAYWGYPDLESLLDENDDAISGFTGLKFVKSQLLPRSGISWVELTQMVQTNFINPLLPTGKNKTMFDGLKFSYRFLQTLIDSRQPDAKKRLRPLAEFLVQAQIINVAEMLSQDANSSHTSQSSRKKTSSSTGKCSVDDDAVRQWVYDHFEELGRIIVLEFDEGPFLSTGSSLMPGALRGSVFAAPTANSATPQAALPDGLQTLPDGSIGVLTSDGRITGPGGALFATVTITGAVVMADAISGGKSLNVRYPGYQFTVRQMQPQTDGSSGSAEALPAIAWINGGSLMVPGSGTNGTGLRVVQWVLSENQGSGCNIDNVRLQHLNGDALGIDEWDRLHRFIRLWRKLGWRVEEVDRAIMGLFNADAITTSPAAVAKGTPANSTSNGIANGIANGVHSAANGTVLNGLDDPDQDLVITFDDYTTSNGKSPPSNGTSSSGNSRNPSQKGQKAADVTPFLIDQLSAIVRVLPLVSISLEQLLCLWTDIPTVAVASTTSTTGTKSLYERLFFTGNLKRNDPVFGPDANGDYFTGSPQKLSDNLPVVMAAFKVKADDIRYLLGLVPDAFGTPNPSPLQDVLSIPVLSQIYRAALLSQVLGIKLYDVGRAIQGFGPAFESAIAFYDFIHWWDIMESLNFPWEELRFIVDEISTPDDPLKHTATSLLGTAKTINDGINAIKAQYMEVTDPSHANMQCTNDIIKARLALVCDDDTAAKILGLLNGTNTFSTVKAPIVPETVAAAFAKSVTKAVVSGKLTYVPSMKGGKAQLLCKGIMTADEMEAAHEVMYLFDEAMAVTVLATRGTPASKMLVSAKEQVVREMKTAWSDALAALAAQPKSLFMDLFAGIFDTATVDLQRDPSTTTILAGDMDENATDPPVDAKRPSEKRFFFMQHFIPYLQQTLARNFVRDTVISDVGFQDRTLAQTILENVAIHGKVELDYLLELLDPVGQDPNNFQGYLIVPCSDSYAFIYPDNSDTGPAPITLDYKVLTWTIYQDDTAQRYWATDASRAVLKAGTPYTASFVNLNPSLLEWKPASNFRATVPASVYMPKIALNQALEVYNRLKMTAILVNHFPLTSDEVIYIIEHKGDFGGMDFSSLSMAQWKRIQAFMAFRQSLPSSAGLQLIDLFKWCTQNPTAVGSALASQISLATTWMASDIEAMLARVNFSVGTGNDFRNEIILVRLSKLIALSDTLGVDIPRLFHWSLPLGTASKDYFKLVSISADIVKVIRSKLDATSWNDAVRPLNDVLRGQQRDALIAYLLVQDEVRKQGVIDADSLFEFFLIDVQMTPLVETSRIKQAIASVQVFIQRCFLGLEKDVDPAQLDRARWDWMSKYRVWEANRKIFLYPENWIDPTLRDDRSPFFVTFQAALMQKDLTPDIISSAVRSYLYSVNEVSNLEITGLCVETLESHVSVRTETTVATAMTTTTIATTDPDTSTTSTTAPEVTNRASSERTITTAKTRIHLFARTTTSPYSYYYISYSNGCWTAWLKMDIEIPFYTVQNEQGQDVAVGAYMTPIVFGGRLLVFIPQLTKKTSANPAQRGQSTQTLGDSTQDQLKPVEQWEIKMSYTELLDGKWTQRQVCSEGAMVLNWLGFAKNPDGTLQFPQVPDPLRPIDGFSFIASEVLAPEATNPSNRVPVGVRVIASRFTIPTLQKPILIRGRGIFVGIAEWDFIDGHLKYIGAASQILADNQSFQPTVGTDYTVPAPNIFLPQQQMENIQLQFGYQLGEASNSAILHPFTATDDLPSGAGPRLDAFFDAPMVAKGKVHSPFTPKVAAQGRAILITKTIDPVSGNTVQSTQLLYHKFMHQMMSAAKTPGPGTSALLSLYSYLGGLQGLAPGHQGPNLAASEPFPGINTTTGQLNNTEGFVADLMPAMSDLDEAFGGLVNSEDQSTTGRFNELSTPFSLYNWEIGLHAPMLLVDRLLQTQQFDAALSVCHYIFNPLVQGTVTDPKEFWTFAPFKRVVTQTAEQVFLNFKAGQFSQDVAHWRDAPFQPYVIARSRPQAYMMWVVMKYIEILIAYGDYYFRQNTLETIPEAIQMYILASHLYGPRGQVIPRPTPKKTYTYNQLATKFDAFSNAMVQMEEAFPFSNQTPLPVGKLPDDSSTPLVNVFGFAGTLFFAIPSNPNVAALGATIDDRLFKIRNSQDINGIFRQLPLFEPPIDPALLVQAAAQGVSLQTVLQDLNGPMPNSRFQLLLAKALEMAQDVRSLGSSLLAIREKGDAEALSVLRAKHDTNTQTILMALKKLTLDEANKTLEALEYSRQAPISRLSYYLQQVGADLSGIPAVDQEFIELNARIEQPVAVGGLELISSEQEEMNQYSRSADLSNGVAVLEVIGSAMNILPNFSAQFMPLGCGGSSMFGGSNLGAYYQAIARGASMAVSNASFQAGAAGRRSQALRALQDRILQANMAGYEISNIDKQITTSKVRIALASKDIDVQQKQIDQAREMEDFLRQKYSNTALYAWLEAATRRLYYNTYTQAYDLAKKAEKAFHFERPALQSTSFMQSGYWDASRDGLLAGESLFLALKQLEARYLEDRGYDYEITKYVSLRQLDPLALLQLRSSGSCAFDLPEVLFDMDFPGHYMRRIRSAAVTLPCIVGPYTSINSTLRLKAHKIRFQPSNASGSAYVETTDQSSANSDPRFTTSTIPIAAIVACSGQSDTGTFNFETSSGSQDRYLPFEGAGAISSWSFSLPQHPDSGFRQFDWQSITDLVLSLQYTSIDGGAQMMQGAQTAVAAYLKRIDFASSAGGFWAFFDIRYEFASAWTAFLATTAAAPPSNPSSIDTPTAVSLPLPDLNDKLPVFAASRPAGSVVAHDIYVFADHPFPGQHLALRATSKDAASLIPVVDLSTVPAGLTGYQVKGTSVVVGGWELGLDTRVAGTAVQTSRAWLLFRYTMK